MLYMYIGLVDSRKYMYIWIELSKWHVEQDMIVMERAQAMLTIYIMATEFYLYHQFLFQKDCC